MTKIDKVEIVKLVIEFDNDIEDSEIDLGGLYFQKEDRQYALDVCRSIRKGNVIEAYLEDSEETFSECNYALTQEDLVSGVDVQLYIESDTPIYDIHLIAKIGRLTLVLQVNQQI